MYADDAVLIYIAESQEELNSMMQNDLDLILEWMARNLLSLNTSKTFLMLFGRAKNCTLSLTAGTAPIMTVKEFKYLGLVIDTDLSFNAHVDHVIKAVSPFASLMWKRSRFIPPGQRKQLYFAYVESHLIYMCNIWKACPEYRVNDLFLTQKRCIKSMMELPRLTPTTYLFSQSILPVRLLFDYHSLLVTHKMLNGRMKHNFVFASNESVSGRQTRRGQDIHIFNHYGSQTTGSVLMSGILREYNNLSSEIKQLNETKKMRNLLKIHLFDSQMEFCRISPFMYLN